MKLLLIEDESGIVLGLYRALNSNYTIDNATTGRAGLQKIAHTNYDVIILDLNLPDMPGLEICERVRSNGITVPILVLSGLSDTQTKVTLLDSGANDYLTKPFRREELEARLRVLTRQAKPKPATPSRLVVGDLILDTAKHQATRGGVPISLRRKEFNLLECLMQNAGKVVTQAILAAHAWDEEHEALNNTIHVHINHLRAKVDRPFKTPLIKTVHGLGYKIDASKLVAHNKLNRGEHEGITRQDSD
jgi:DNA-binding response OmpR family regulator